MLCINCFQPFTTASQQSRLIKLLEVLLKKYHNQERLFLSWDAASWHVSKALYERVDGINKGAAAAKKVPLVQLAPYRVERNF
jgi:hypothetical protein